MGTYAQESLDFTAKRDLPPEVRERIEQGMATADANADGTWKRWIDGCIQDVARRMPEFTVDDVLEALEKLPNPPDTHNLAALGPRMSEVAKSLCYMERTDRVKRSTRPEKRGNFHRIWKSLIYVAS